MSLKLNLLLIAGQDIIIRRAKPDIPTDQIDVILLYALQGARPGALLLQERLCLAVGNWAARPLSRKGGKRVLALSFTGHDPNPTSMICHSITSSVPAQLRLGAPLGG
jgi:hypothetical protein